MRDPMNNYLIDGPPSQTYALSLHDALPIYSPALLLRSGVTLPALGRHLALHPATAVLADRSEEHTSELQSRGHLVCRLLLEKKKITLAARWGLKDARKKTRDDEQEQDRRPT